MARWNWIKQIARGHIEACEPSDPPAFGSGSPNSRNLRLLAVGHNKVARVKKSEAEKIEREEEEERRKKLCVCDVGVSEGGQGEGGGEKVVD